ncbi:PsbB mRNA maturation factor Mbb1, chloroplastic [Galdieria sulphuraria]|nr:PsbB mRNA maturation factor Mbb1, chloroplastic [Galdieria sulphuraria]
MLEAKCGNIQQSRDVFEMALKKLNTFPPQEKIKRRASWNAKAGLYRAWANVEESFGNISLAMELLSKAVSECPVESETYFALAKLEYKCKNWLNARRWIQLAETVGGPINVAIYSFWAILEEKLNHVDIARQLLEKASRIYVADCSIVQTWATLEQRAGNLNKARELFQKSIDIRPNAPAFVAWALMEEQEANFEAARMLFQRALLVDTLHSPTYNAYALYEARQGNLQAARAILEDGMRKVCSPCILHGYAQLELKYCNDISKAKQLLLEGTKCAYEDNSFVWHSLGYLELLQRNYKEAIHSFEQGISRYPRNSLLYLGLALCYVAILKEPDWVAKSNQAGTQLPFSIRRNFEEAIQCDPFHAHAWQAWGVFELSQGRYEVARDLLKRGIQNCSTHVALWQALGLLEAQSGNMHRAREIFKRGSLLPFSYSHVRLYHTWACCELRAGAVEQARRLLEEALKCDNTHGPVWNVYGMLEEHHGSIIRAKELFKEGIQQAPKHVHLYISYALFEFRQGNEAKANELFHLAFQIDPHHSYLKEIYSKFNEMFLLNRKKYHSSGVEMQKRHSRTISHVNFSWFDMDLLSELESSTLAMDACATLRVQS